MADDNLWTAFARIGIDAIHTGPVKMAGGIQGWEHTPSIDGHFDRISMAIDPQFGTDDEFRAMCAAAAAHNGSIIDDIVPGPHRQGRRLPARRAELQGLPRHLPHDRHPAGGLVAAPRRARGA